MHLWARYQVLTSISGFPHDSWQHGGGTGHTGLRFVCLETKGTRFPELPDFPAKPCRGGIMTVHHFPALVVSLVSLRAHLFADQNHTDAGMARISTARTTKRTCKQLTELRYVTCLMACGRLPS